MTTELWIDLYCIGAVVYGTSYVYYDEKFVKAVCFLTFTYFVVNIVLMGIRG